MKQYGDFHDIFVISCDSINPATNDAIGRKDRGSGKPFDNVGKLFEIKEWCEQHNIRFKLNTASVLDDHVIGAVGANFSISGSLLPELARRYV